MPAHPKIRSPDNLRHAYIDLGMSTTEISRGSKDIFGFFVTPATVYNCLIRYGIRPRSKSESVLMAKNGLVKLTDIAGRTKKGTQWNNRYWNARWLVSSNVIKTTKTGSLLTPDEATKLRQFLEHYGDKSAIPDALVDEEFEKARGRSFPYNEMTIAEKLHDWNNLIKAETEKVNGMYSWTGLESRLATSFHPHFYECRRKGRMSPLEFFQSDDDLKRGIRKVLSLKGKMTIAALRDICRNEDASGPVNNFPPRVVLALLKDIYPTSGGLKLLDPCSGFSGRIIGCAASGKIAEYHGIDLSAQTVDGLQKTREFLETTGSRMKSSIIHGDCTKVMPTLDTDFDVVFTSPPFLDVEEYKGVDPEHDYGRWLTEFVRPFVQAAVDRLLPGGRLVIYSENINSRKAFSDDFRRLANDAGLAEEPPVVFKKSRGTYQRSKQKFKPTPIYVWSRR
jgi:hypothetical protein